MGQVRRPAGVTLSWHPAYATAIVSGVMVIGGFALLALGWRGAAATAPLVPLQVPYAASGGLAGLAMIGIGALLLNLQVGRHLGARERARTREVARLATQLVIAARARPSRASASGSSSSTS